MMIAPLLAKALAIAVVIYAPCPGDPVAAGCALRDTNTVYVNPTSMGEVRLQPVSGVVQLQNRNHELGHIIDYNFLTNADRGMFEAIVHIRRPWVDPPNSPQEWFAEAVRLCGRSSRWLSRYTLNYGYQPTLYQHRKVCRWLATIGARP
jgi:hypothetical protein